MINIRNIDLNLLVVFEALMQERNVTRTADRLGLSQPAISLSLRRLRESLDDPLFIRTRGGMRPTRRAEQIFSSVAQALDSVQNILQTGTSFSPNQAQRSFNVMMSDIGEIIYLPRLIQKLRQVAPGVRLSVRRLARPRVHDELASGGIDLAIGWVETTADLIRDDLFDEKFVGIVRPDHPRIGKRISLAQFASEWHLVVGRQELASDSLFLAANDKREQALARAFRQRKVAVQVPHFLAVPNIISHTDLICVVPRQLGDIYAELGQVRPATLPPGFGSFTVSQFWHKRFEKDQGSLWLRGVVRELFASPQNR
ncbi:LysR family transcriptional regulator [Pseudolabrys taiwanensis]|uniref:LysR family transcriptional regulator n=1 Tax=Pseudolabrys taiwanensis TaxID=331696 RepID=A0A345ZUX8_9HYPH|nr:LysR family transcriptional regulator [Pseudolabrys taiwanensis]AXK80725.1 LysR family transcriptional regulator [Pseudolabrys taiwanensis]